MTFTGEIKTIMSDQITFTFPDLRAEAEKLRGKKLSIDAKLFREKRSLDANAYAWKLMSEIAAVLKSSKEEVYELMLQRYGSDATDDDGNLVLITVPYKTSFKSVDIHCAYYDTQYLPDGEMYRYRLIKGSSLYDTAEMSRLIDGIVSEAQDLEIQTLTPDEIRMMKERWGV